jgi:hypothetical protein
MEKAGMVVCVGCGKEAKPRPYQFVPDGWLFTHPNKDGQVDPSCGDCLVTMQADEAREQRKERAGW